MIPLPIVHGPLRVVVSWLLVVLLVVLVAGCGYQLRGTQSGGSGLKCCSWVLVDQSAAAQTFARTLRRAGVPDSASAPARPRVVELRRLVESRQAAAVDSRVREAEFEIVSMLVYRIVDPDGTEVRSASSIREKRTYLVDRNNILGSSREEDILRQELNQQLVAELLRVLYTL